MVNGKPVVGAIIQARAASRRLPGKIFLKLPFGGSQSVVENIVMRARSAPSIDKVVIATSTGAENDALLPEAVRAGAEIFRGSEADVLCRFVEAASKHRIDVIVRLTADNPCIDPRYIESSVQEHLRRGADYTLTTGLPLGLNVEVVNFAALQRIHGVTDRADDREHVTHYITRNPGEFRVAELAHAEPGYEALRLTVDWPGDYAFACFIYENLGQEFGLEEILELLARQPWAALINGGLRQQRFFETVESEIHEALSVLDLHGFPHASERLRRALGDPLR